MKRKVRVEFDKTKEYSVDVSECTEEEKKEVQQAFFDAGFKWEIHGEAYMYTDAVKFTNTTCGGGVIARLMHNSTIEGCNMTAKEFLDLVYEPEQVGHVHAELMAQYAEDAKTHAEPWELWQIKDDDGVWWDCNAHPRWANATEYRHKTKTHIVNGVEIPDLRESPEYGDGYYLASTSAVNLTSPHTFVGDSTDMLWLERGLVYQKSEEGRLAAVLHSKAMLGIA